MDLENMCTPLKYTFVLMFTIAYVLRRNMKCFLFFILHFGAFVAGLLLHWCQRSYWDTQRYTNWWYSNGSTQTGLQ